MTQPAHITPTGAARPSASKEEKRKPSEEVHRCSEGGRAEGWSDCGEIEVKEEEVSIRSSQQLQHHLQSHVFLY